MLKTALIILIIIKSSVCLSQVVIDDKTKFINNFMSTMSKQEKLDNYVNNLNNRIVNYFRVDKYQIKKITDNEVVVEIDHGKGVYCTRIYLTIINPNGVYQLKSYANNPPPLALVPLLVLVFASDRLRRVPSKIGRQE